MSMGGEKATMRASSLGSEGAAPVETVMVSEKDLGATPLAAAKKQGEGSSKAVGDVVKSVDPVVPDVAAAEKLEAVVKRTRLSLSLTKEEIEADFLAFTGALPPKQPLKRELELEAKLEGIFPGSYLGAILSDETDESDDPQPPSS